MIVTHQAMRTIIVRRPVVQAVQVQHHLTKTTFDYFEK